MIHLPQREHALSNDTPGFVGIGVVADDLGGDHERRDEEAVTGRTPGGRESGFETLEENKRGEGDGGVEFCSVKSIGDEVWKFRLGMSGRWGVFGACEEMGDESGTQASYGLVTKKGVLACCGRLR